MSIQRIALIFALPFAALYGQPTSPVVPVREVDGFARTSIRGLCLTVVNVGQENSGFDPCALRTTAGAPLNSLVPDKKILVIEEVSARCTRGSLDAFAEVSVNASGATTLRIIPLTTQGTAGGVTRDAGFTAGRIYFWAGEEVGNRVTMVAPASQQANCVAVVSGYLVDVQ